MAVSRGCQHPFYYFFILNRSVLVKNYTVFLYKVINLQGNQDICNEKDQEAKTGPARTAGLQTVFDLVVKILGTDGAKSSCSNNIYNICCN